MMIVIKEEGLINVAWLVACGRVCCQTLTLLGLLLVSFFSNAQSPSIAELDALAKRGDYQQVLERANASPELENSYEGLHLIALSHLQLGDYSQAQRAYTKLIKINKAPTAYNNLGIAYLRQSNISDAISTFQLAVKEFPTHPTAYHNLGETYLLLSQLSYLEGERATSGTAPSETLKFKGQKVSALIRQSKVKVDSDFKAQQETLNTENIKAEISRFLNQWAKARSHQELEKRLSHYTETAVIQWSEGQNYELANKADSSIKESPIQQALSRVDAVSINEPNINVHSDIAADVVFDEWSGPASSRKRSFKQIKLKRESDRWFIEQEVILFSY